ncbi:FGGY-family carbohydrate kinase [Asticcacaulis sp. AC466]|uniref:FGGY-family carbohydrate kinase n=1 Tax=Asticcacaulis sp. AC466 TaxID=1282362 RepID=UPI0005536B24|nr:FGGY family carbohydrate kinase [Asticcacaulis sp. AC466]
MPGKARGKCVVFDIGKTHTKASVVGADGFIWAQRRTRTPHFNAPLYRAIDVDAIHAWFVTQLRDFGRAFFIDRIIPVTHGATCAFLDEEERLVQPVQDYESVVPAPFAEAYGRIRPLFSETQSPHLPQGLNLGCQIFWHAQRDPKTFARVRWILNYPQYWAWRLSGELSNEVTSMGCHTDLWSPAKGQFSTLAHDQHWTDRFPAMRPAWERQATLRSDIARAAELPPSTQVCVGLHDSNAALAGSLLSPQDRPQALLSTGTWFVAMAPGAPIAPLAPQRDCLANVDIFGTPVACSRFMGGRVYGHFNQGDRAINQAALRAVMEAKALAMPSFSDCGGPFPTLRGEIRGLGDAPPEYRAALGALYLASMSSTCLDLIHSEADLLIEGPLAQSPHLCGLLAALRPGAVLVNDTVSGVTLGAAALSFYGETSPPLVSRRPVKPLFRKALRAYHHLWRTVVDAELTA